MITSQEEIDDLLDINKKLSEINFIFVQAKTSSSFDYGDMGTFGAGVKDFFSDNPQMRRNDAITEKSKLVGYIFSKATYIKKKPVCSLCYVTTGKWVDDQNCIEMCIRDRSYACNKKRGGMHSTIYQAKRNFFTPKSYECNILDI